MYIFYLLCIIPIVFMMFIYCTLVFISGQLPEAVENMNIALVDAKGIFS